MLLFMRAKGHSIVGTDITREGKLVNYEHCFEKGSRPKENFLHKKRFFCTKWLPNITFYVCKMSFNCRYHITRQRKTSQLWALFWKRFMPKRNFLHKKGFFCIKVPPNVTFYASKRSFNCRYQYHTRREH